MATMRAERAGLGLGLVAGVLVQVLGCNCPEPSDPLPLEVNGSYTVAHGDGGAWLESGPISVTVDDESLVAEIPMDDGTVRTVSWHFTDDEDAWTAAGGCSSSDCRTSDTGL